MNELKNINAALVSAYLAVNPTLPTAFEGKDFQAPNGVPWGKVTNFPADRYVSSLGVGGTDNYTGFFQIDYFVPENDGTKRLYGMADATTEYFKNGRRFTYSGQTVRVRRIQLSQIRRDPDSARLQITLSVYWDSDTTR